MITARERPKLAEQLITETSPDSGSRQVPSAQRSDSLPVSQISARPLMNKHRFRIGGTSKTLLPVSLCGLKTACGTAPAHPQGPPS
jgi:hypothetical protein